MQHVLDSAGLSRRTYYQHFRSLEDLLRALYEHVTDELLSAVRKGMKSSDDPVRRLFAALDGYLDFQLAGGDLLILLQAEAIRPDSLLSDARERTLDGLVELTADEVDKDVGVRFDPLVLRGLFLGVDGMCIHEQRGGTFTRAGRDRIAAAIKPMFLAVLLSARHMPQPPS